MKCERCGNEGAYLAREFDSFVCKPCIRQFKILVSELEEKFFTKGDCMNQDMQKRLDKDFTYHPPKTDQADRYTAMRAKAKELAEFIANNTPASREQSVAFTKIDEAVFWANASIARNE